MAAQSGKDMLLKLDQTGAGSFLTVAGLRTRQIAFNAASVDTTDAESAGRWRELLEGGGVKRAAVSGPFQIVALEYSGDHAGEVTFELALESAGEIGFSAV